MIEHAAAWLQPASLPFLVSAVAIAIGTGDGASAPVTVTGDLAAGPRMGLLLTVAAVLLPTDRSHAASTFALCLVGQDGQR